MENIEKKENTIYLWHGGRDLEYNYKKITPAKGLWEYGPGLYLSTSYLRAKSYAKGGGKTYQVEITEGKDINQVYIPIEKVQEFVSEYVIKNKRKELLEDIFDNMKRMKDTSKIKAEHFMNLIINLEAIQKPKTDKLCHFLVENGVDYLVSHGYGGSNESIMVIFNRDVVKKIKPVNAKDVSLSDYDLSLGDFDKRKTKLKI